MHVSMYIQGNSNAYKELKVVVEEEEEEEEGVGPRECVYPGGCGVCGR